MTDAKSLTKILHGDVIESLKGVANSSFDACLCDPPYGLSFMSKKWDYDVPSTELWSEVLRVLKPGAPLIAFGGTRTYHRMVVRIEDAGFEIRDQLAWMYGQGFPKSLDVGKAIDDAAGAERKVVGKHPNPAGNKAGGTAYQMSAKGMPSSADITAAATELAQQWDGYGTALKPAWECAVFAAKPLDIHGIVLTLAQKLTEAVCRLSSLAKDAGSLSASSRSALEPLGSAAWAAVARCSTPADLFALMGTWPSESGLPSSLSIASSWLLTLAEASTLASTFTTETESSLTTDLRTLSFSPSSLTPESIIEASMGPRGTKSRASLAASVFAAVASRLAITRAAPAR